MRIEIYSYRYAEAVLNDVQLLLPYTELMDVLRSAQAPVYLVDKVKKRQRGNSPARFLPVNQKMLNSQIEAAMPRDWEIRPLVVEPSQDGPSTKIRSDFKKGRIQVEVQFGNMARWYTDVFKFQLAYSRDAIDVGILVVPTSKFANLIDENVASFERVIRELPWAKMSLTLPILVVGIEPEDYSDIKVRYEEAAAAWQAENPTKTVKRFEDALELEPNADDSETDN